MGLKLSDLQKDRRTLPVPVVVNVDETGGVTTADLTITYRPSAYTPKMERDINEKFASDWKSSGSIAFILTLLVEWDLMEGEGDDEHVIPLTVEDLAGVPTSVLGDIITAISDDLGKRRAVLDAG